MKTRQFTGALIVAFMLSVPAGAQKYFTKSAHVNFFSSTAAEDIEANNHKAISILNSSSGEIEFSMLVMSFEFKKALMQEHFNENYMESGKFPKASFKGKIVNLDKINFQKDGNYPAQVKGSMTIHGVTREVTATATFTVKNGKISGSSVFNVNPSDYDISIPGAVKDKIAKDIKVTVNSSYEEMKK